MFTFLRSSLLVLAAVALSSTAAAQEKFTYLTNWFAQAEHGGFYQALAQGLYRKAGLEVTLRMGGPQVNGMQLMAAGQADCYMGYDVQTLKVHEQGVRAVTVAAIFQKDPLVMIGHPGVFSRMEDLRGKSILISSDARTNYWPWLRTKYGLQDSQVRPYTFNVQPFIADKGTVQQGYLSSEPFAIEKQAGFKPTALLLADHGWPPYATTVVCMEDTLRQRPKAVAAFLQATMEGWRSYLRDDPTAANALIKRDNPQMTDEQIAYGIRMMKQMELVTGGDAARMGIGAMTTERLKATFDMMVAMKLIDPAKVDFRRTFNVDLMKNIRVMP